MRFLQLAVLARRFKLKRERPPSRSQSAAEILQRRSAAQHRHMVSFISRGGADGYARPVEREPVERVRPAGALTETDVGASVDRRWLTEYEERERRSYYRLFPRV